VIAVIVIISLILSLTPLIRGKKGNTLAVTANGVTSEYSLANDRVLTVNGVTVVIEKGQAFVRVSKCDDKICVKQGKISRVNESVVCLPQGVVLTITGESEFDASSGQEK
jgi:hypothetical protein